MQRYVDLTPWTNNLTDNYKFVLSRQTPEMNSSLPNFLIGLSLPLLLLSCGGSADPAENGLSLNFSDAKKAYAVNKNILISVQNQKNLPIDSVVYSLDGDPQISTRLICISTFSLRRIVFALQSPKLSEQSPP